MMPKTCTTFYLPLIRHEQQFGLGLALRKETLRRQGVLASAKSRDPGPSLDQDDLEELQYLFDRLLLKAQSHRPSNPRKASTVRLRHPNSV